MGRRSGFEGIIMAAARASARAERQAETANRRELAAREREYKAYLRNTAKNERDYQKKAKADYLQLRTQEAEDLKRDSDSLFNYLKDGIIPETLQIDDTIDFETLKPKFEHKPFNIPKHLNNVLEEPQKEKYVNAVGKLPMLASIFPFLRKRWEEKIQNANDLFEGDLLNWQNITHERAKTVDKLKIEYEESISKYEADYLEKCKAIDEFKIQYLGLDPEAVISYVSMVLERSSYSIEWDREYKVAYSPDSKEILVEFRLPGLDIIPKLSDAKYVKSRDEIDEKFRKTPELDSCYKAIIANLAIRTIHEIVESDQAKAVLIISFNGYINSIDTSNGKSVSPMLISVSSLKSDFELIQLAKVDPIRCIQGLSASVSSSPRELVAIKPIREFSMVDKRFIQEEDIASTLDTRPNLMDLNPFEFENLVGNLFSKMGLETKQTRSSKDGGVDAVAFDKRPILGGKIIIQAKRYKNTVGVSAVRDLYGTMLNEGASKGILVTTSSYGPDAYQFSKDKPIELIDGGGLIYLLNQVGINSKIIIPE